MTRRAITGMLGLCLILMGLNCSRERVESMTHMNEGVAYAEAGRYRDATKMLERATALDPTNDQAFWNLGIVNVEMRNFTAARDALERAIALKPDNGAYSEKLGEVLVELHDWKGAKDALEKAIGTDESLHMANFKLGRVHEELEDPQSALHAYTEAVMQGPTFVPAYAALGRLYADLKYPDNAAQVLREGLKVTEAGSEDEANLHHILGTVLQQQRKFGEAVSEFQTALSIEPSNRDALFSLGWTYSLQGNTDEATRYLKKFLLMAGADAPAHYVQAAKDRLAEIKLATTPSAVGEAAE